MKKIIYIVSVFTLLFGCQKAEVEDVFNESPEARVKKKIDEINTLLLSSETGWYAEYKYNNDKNSTLLHFNFKESNRVEIASSFKNYTKKESNYTLFYSEQLNLVFNTHNVLASFVGKQQKADYRWELVSMNNDEIKFTSRAKSNEGESELILKKSNGEHIAIIENQYNLKPKLLPNPNRSFYRILEINGHPTKFSFSFNENNYSLTFTYKDTDGTIKTHTSKINVIDADNFSLESPLIVNGKEIKFFKYNASDETFSVKDSELQGEIKYGTKAFEIKGAVKELLKPNGAFTLTSYSNAMIPAMKKLKELPNYIDLQWYIRYFGGSFNGNLVRSISEGKTVWKGPLFQELKPEGEDVVKLVWNFGFRGFELNTFLLYVPYLRIVKDELGFDVIPLGNGNFILVSVKDPRIYFTLTKF